MTKLKKKYRTSKSDKQASEYKEYLAVTREITVLVREISQEIVAEGLDAMTRQINDTLQAERELQEEELEYLSRPRFVQPTFTYVDNAKPGLGRYKGVGTLPQGCQTCGANHRPM